ncbi:MAG: DUF885 family protein [Veillonellales bacterium]
METYQQLIQSFHDYFTQDANDCIRLGVTRHLDDLPDPSLAAISRRVTNGGRLLSGFQNFSRDHLSFDRQLDLDLGILALKSELFRLTYRFNGKTQLEQMPTAGDDISNGLFYLFINDPRPAQSRLDNITARLEKVPAFLAALLGRLDTPVQRWVDMDVAKTAELPAFFASLCTWAKREQYPGIVRLKSARKKAETALADYTAKLQTMTTTVQFSIGPDQAARLIALKGIDLSLDELHRLAKNFLAATTREIETLRRKLAAKYNLPDTITVEELQAFLNHKYRFILKNGSLDSLLPRYQQERNKIQSFIEKQNLFPLFSEQDMLILRTPAFMTPSIPSGAMVSPPPFRPGVKTSLIYLTLSEELLDDHTELAIPCMMIHEGIPGHHLQLATACSHPSVIRRHFDAQEHSEGWTTMLEDYMLDRGYMGDLTDEARFTGKRDISRIGARTAIDLYFMTGDKHYLDVDIPVDFSSNDPFVNAGRLLQAVTGFTPGRTQAELNWYSQERGYPLCYLVGNHLVWQLKKELTAAQAGRLSSLETDRLFHKVYLESGNMPLSFLRKLFQNKNLL